MIEKVRLSVNAVEILEANGWFETRHVKVIPYPNDFKFPENVQSILESLYGLNIETEPRESTDDNVEPCFYGDLEFFPQNATGENENGTFAHFSSVLRRNLYPLGEITNGFFYIAIDDDENLYLVGDNLIKIGDDLYQGLNALLTGIKGKEFNEASMNWNQ